MATARLADIDESPETIAKRARLVYIEERDDGLSRRRRGSGFSYCTPSGATLNGGQRLRCEELVIPPAWTDVWICSDPRGHIQAVGRDDAGRLQYRYHDDFRAMAEQAKYRRLLPFGHAIERIRRTVAIDLLVEDPGRRAVAAGVRLVDKGLVRVGNDEPADPDDAVGVTTMAADSAVIDLDAGTIELDYTGKSGRPQRRAIEDPVLAGVVAELRKSACGEHLLDFVEGERGRRVTSTLLNQYLQGASGQAFTAKDFRTWGGTVTVAEHLARHPDEGEVGAVDAAAERLGNTRAVARASYTAPVITAAYESGMLAEVWQRTRTGKWMTRAERAVVRVLEAQSA